MSDLRRTPLHAQHAALGARLGDFAGWEMPLHYADGARAEHLAVRERLGIFDVSHMGEIEITGPGARAFLQRALTNDIDEISDGEGQYTLMCRDDGGVVDDLIAYALSADRFRLVVNASNIDACLAQLGLIAAPETEIADVSGDVAMLALQGVGWKEALSGISGADLSDLAWFGITTTTLCGHESLVARTGYTGEPGIELMCPWGGAEEIWSALAGPEGPASPCGLVARDTLRLEMGYPLYGNDLSLMRTPIEASLRWAVDLDGPAFVGSDVIRAQASDGASRRLTAFRFDEPGIPRAGQSALVDGREVGTVTSGTLSPSLGIGIGMAYLATEFSAPDTAISVDVRGKIKSATTARRPLVDTSPTKGDA